MRRGLPKMHFQRWAGPSAALTVVTRMGRISDYVVEVVERYIRVLDVYIIRLDLGALRRPQPSSGLCGPAVASMERYHRKLSRLSFRR